MNPIDDLKTNETINLFETVKKHIESIGNKKRSIIIYCYADDHDLQVMRQLYPAFDFFTTSCEVDHYLHIRLKNVTNG